MILKYRLTANSRVFATISSDLYRNCNSVLWKSIFPLPDFLDYCICHTKWFHFIWFGQTITMSMLYIQSNMICCFVEQVILNWMSTCTVPNASINGVALTRKQRNLIEAVLQYSTVIILFPYLPASVSNAGLNASGPVGLKPPKAQSSINLRCASFSADCLAGNVLPHLSAANCKSTEPEHFSGE